MTTLCFLMGTFALIAVPGFSGFFSKEAILDAALEKEPIFFWTGVSVAALTTFYMARLCIVAFCSGARSHEATKAHEVGPTMLLPLILLACMAIISGYGFIADRLVPAQGFEAHGFEIGLPFYASLGSLILGLAAAFVFYGCGRHDTDPLAGNALSTILRKRLYIDAFYDKFLIGFVQERFAQIIEFIDAFIIRGLIAQGLGWFTGLAGKVLSRIQGGSIRGYAFVAGLGVAILVFILAAIFINPSL